MREKRTAQRSLFELYAEHEIGQELKAMSEWLDGHTDLLDWVAADVNSRNVERRDEKACQWSQCCVVRFSNSIASSVTRSWCFA